MAIAKFTGLFLICVIFRSIGVKVGPKTETLCTPCSLKIGVFQKALNIICTTMRTTYGQNFSSIWCCLLELLPQNSPKWAQLGPITKIREQNIQKNWNLASRTFRGMFLLLTMWEFLITLWRNHRGQFRPSLGPKKMFLFCLILQEFFDFSETWVLRYLIFLRMQFLWKFWFLVIFLVYQC